MRAEPAPRVPPALLQAVYAHAAAAWPRECCGLLCGPRGGTLDEVRRCVNAQDAAHAADPRGFPRDARTAFALAPADVADLEAGLGGPRPPRVLYHSHVDAPAALSAEDARQALLGDAPLWPLLHLVVEVRGGTPRGARLYAWDPAGRRFREVAAYAASGAESTPKTGAPARAAL